MPLKYAKPLHFELLETRSMLSATVFEHNNIGYFLNGSKIERYDISQEQWLTPIQLTGSVLPSVGLVDNDGIYVAAGATVYRYNLDGTGQTHLLNAPSTVSALHTDGNVLFVNHSSGLYAKFTSISKTTNTLIDTIEQYVSSVYGSSISPEANKIFGRSQGISPADITYVSYADSGDFIGGGDSPYHGDYGGGPPTWVFPDGGRVTDTSGNIYSTNSLTRLNSFALNITDVDFVGGTIPIVLSGGNTLTAFTQGILPTGSKTLSKSAGEIFVNDQSVIAFAVDGTNAHGYSAEIVSLSALSAPQPGEAINPIGLPFTPDKIVQAGSGEFLIFSKTHQSVFRWNPVTQTFGTTIPLVGVPDFMAYSSVNNTIYLAYNSGLIRKIDLSAPTLSEVPFATLPSSPGGLSTAGAYVFAEDPSGAWVSHYTFGPNGQQISAVDWNYYSSEYIWSPVTQKMYFFRDDTSPNDLLWETINSDGTIGGMLDSPLHSSEGFMHPIRVAPDGSIVVLGSGAIHDATTLQRKTTSLANSVSDIAWMGTNIYTIRSIGGVSQIQEWIGNTYAPGKVVQLNGTPSSLTSIAGNRLLAVTIGSNGVPSFQVLDSNLQVVPRPTPVAAAGPDVTMIIGQSVTLNGSSSYDPDSAPNPLSYVWSVTGPGTATLGTANASSTTFSATVPGKYTVQLQVSDGAYSNTDTVVVTVRTNAAPDANPSRSAATAVAGRAPATLDGTASTDPDGDALTYLWKIISSPNGSSPSLNNATQSIAGLVASTPGTYTVQLKVSDGILSDTENFTVTLTPNAAPTADASLSDATGVAGRKNAVLRGTTSSDPNGDSLTYRWLVINSPAGSTPSISNSTLATASLAANIPGVYTVELTVSDGLLSDADQVVVTMGANKAPVADATASQTSVVAGGPAAVLDARRSTDPDNDTLTYAWKVLTSSNGNTPTITNSTKALASLSAATAGVYLLELKVSDGLATDSDFVIVTVRGNQPPVADVSLSDRTVMLGKTARLDGTRSSDPDGDALSYSWKVVATSNGITPQISDGSSAVAHLMGQAAGSYAVELTVRDPAVSDTEYLLVSVTNNPTQNMGDFNANNMVDSADLMIWRATIGSTSDLRADANGNGEVDAADWILWRINDGHGVGAAAGVGSAIELATADSSEGATIEMRSTTEAESSVSLPAVDAALSAWPADPPPLAGFRKSKLETASIGAESAGMGDLLLIEALSSSAIVSDVELNSIVPAEGAGSEDPTLNFLLTEPRHEDVGLIAWLDT